METITRIPEPQLSLEQAYELYRAGVADASGDVSRAKTPAVADLLARFRARLFFETVGDAPGDAPDWLRAQYDDEPTFAARSIASIAD